MLLVKRALEISRRKPVYPNALNIASARGKTVVSELRHRSTFDGPRHLDSAARSAAPRWRNDSRHAHDMSDVNDDLAQMGHGAIADR